MISFVFAVYLIITVFLLLVIGWMYLGYVKPLRHLRRSLQAIIDKKADALLFVPNPRSETGKTVVLINQLLGQDSDRRYQLEEKQKEIDRTTRSLDNFAYVVSHDLKGPFNSIKSIAELLRLEYDDKFDESGKELLGFIDIKVNEMDKLLMGVLMYSRVRQDISRVEEVNLNTMLRELAENLQDTGDMEIVINDELPVLTIEPDLIRRIFQELLDNAAAFIKREYGKIEIGVASDSAAHIFYVRDNGPGIDTKYFEKIFNIFYTIREQSQEENSGKGVGLAIVRKIVEFKGGNVWVESQKGLGSTFYFSLPVLGAK